MEADVNVLVVGSSTARRGAIGRHFPRPLIRRYLNASSEALPAKLLSNARQTRRATGRSELGGRRGRVPHRQWEGGPTPLSLY